MIFFSRMILAVKVLIRVLIFRDSFELLEKRYNPEAYNMNFGDFYEETKSIK